MGEDSLIGFIAEATGDSHLRVESDLGDGFVRLKSSEAERRQAKDDIQSTEDIVLEMLRNSRDAGSSLIYLATAREGDRRRITMIDNGEGIPESLRETIFEPRVTSKLDTCHMDKWGIHGRGMALFSIRCNTEVSRVVASDPGKGSALLVETDVRQLPERSDQSSLPVMLKREDGSLVMRGPRNVNRTVAEFVMEEKSACTVYLGSPNDIVATLVNAGKNALGVNARTYHEDLSSYPLCLRPSLAFDPEELSRIAAGLGLDISTRSARRILDGQIEPLSSFIATLTLDDSSQRGKKDHRAKTAEGERRKPVAADARGLKIDEADLSEFSQRVKRAYEDLARDYYLDDDVEPAIRVGKEGINISIPAVKLR